MAPKYIRALVVAVAASIAVAGCGGSGGSSSTAAAGGGPGTTADSSSSTSTGVATAQKLVAQDLQPPKPLDIPSLNSRPRAGVTLDVISCALPECILSDPGYTTAAKLLGWKLNIQHPALTPEAVAAAWTQAIADKPTAILALSLVPDQLVKSQMEQAQRAGTATIMATTALAPGQQGAVATIGSRPTWEANARAMADWAIADSGGKAKIVFLTTSTLPLTLVGLQAAKAEVKTLCPGCTIDGLELDVTQVGKGIPAQVVSYLQQHPDVGYVAAPFPSLVLGVGPAIKSAGLPAKVVSAFSSPADLAAIKSGTEAAAVASETLSGAWREMDVAARLVTHTKASEALLDPVGERQLFETSNVATADTKNIWTVPDVPQTFARAWHVSG